MSKILFYKIVFCVLFFLSFSNSGYSQDLLKSKDLSQIKVEMISESDIAKLKSQLENSGISYDQAEQMAISKGMPALEAAKLKLKLSTKSNVISSNNEKIPTTRENSDPDLQNEKNIKKTPLIDPIIFGSELYSSSSLSFEPNLKMATPINYILGPDDQIQISVYGIQEYNGNLTISPEGNINIPNVGEIKLSGLTIEAATQKIKNILGNSAYSYLKSGGAKLSVTLSKIRTISVTIIGSNRPGNYKVSSLSSVFNALFIAGGPSINGSFREIELIRNNKVERKIDLYHFLLNGKQEDNVTLKENDVIRIPAYKIRVELKGEIKRQGIFEVLPNESFANILEYASGFTDNAYMGSVKIFQRNDKERQIQDLSNEYFKNYLPKSGDVFEVSKILDRFKNRVIIKGAIFRPGQYELTSNMHLADLIKKADGLRSDAYTQRGQIIRLKEDLSQIILSFDIKKAIAGIETDNFLLQKEDEILVTSVNDLKEKFEVSIQGEVRLPGKYNFIDKITLKDLILQSGGFTYAANKRVEVARLLKRDSLLVIDDQKSIILNTEITGLDLSNTQAANMTLEPYDLVTVRKIAGYQLPESVSIQGQIQFPGPYTLGNTVEKVSDIIKRSGGFISGAYPEGAYLKRFKTNIEKDLASETILKLKKSANDSSQTIERELMREFDKIPLDLAKILKSPGGIEDLVLKANDEIFIPKFDGQVKINGEVLLNTQIPFNSTFSFNDYVDAAGGFTANALRRKSFVVYSNGLAASTKNFLFFKSYPKVSPGSEVTIPKKREKRANTMTEIIGISSVLASLVAAFAILKN